MFLIGKICAFGTAITQLHLSRSSEATLKLLLQTRVGGIDDMTKREGNGYDAYVEYHTMACRCGGLVQRGFVGDGMARGRRDWKFK
jgi:hypothetical protein